MATELRKTGITELPMILRYGVAVLSVIAAVIILLLMQSYLEVIAPVLVFLCAIIFNAWFGGVRPGLLTVVLSALAFKYFFLPPIHSLTIETTQLPRLILFVLLALFIASLSSAQKSTVESLRRARDDLQRNNEILQAENGERRRAEEARLASEARLQAAIDAADIGLWDWDLVSGQIIGLGHHDRLFGFFPGEFDGTFSSFEKRIHPEDLEKLNRAIQRAREDGSEYAHEYRVNWPDGSVHWIAGRGRFLYDKTGQPVRMHGAVLDITERSKTDEALRQSECDLAEAQRVARLGSWSFDIATNTVRWSEELYRIFDIEKTAFGGNYETFLSRIHPDDHTRVLQANTEARSNGKPFEVEYRITTRSGQLKHIREFGHVRKDSTGIVSGLFGTAQDITERKQVEQVLQRSEDHLRLVIDTIPTMVWSLRPDGALDFVNQRWLDYAGVSLEEAVKQPTHLIHPEDLPSVMKKWLTDMAASEPSENELRLRRADGEYRWFWVRTAPLRDEQGNLVKWYGTGVDITERKQAEEKLKQSESRLAEAQRVTHVGSWNWDLRSNTVTWSDELYCIFGLQPQEIEVDRKVMQNIHPEDRDWVMSAVENSLKTKEPYSFYYRVLRPDGEERIVHSRGYVVKDEYEYPIRVFGTTQDVTERRRAEEQLRTITEQLRALSARLGLAREEESIRIAREIHDELGAALSSLRWDLEDIDEVISELTDISQLAALRKKIEDMVSLLDTTVNTVRRIASELRPLALDELGLVEAIKWQAQQFQDRTGIIVECDCQLDELDLDREVSTAVFRIYQEALTNILRHAQAKKVDIMIKQEVDEFLLMISDNGKGITQDEKFGAQSLGLLGMTERAHLIGGEINIEGAEGLGTVITLRVPIPAKPTGGSRSAL
jgi:PAS domain S-box-containing protein